MKTFVFLAFVWSVQAAAARGGVAKNESLVSIGAEVETDQGSSVEIADIEEEFGEEPEVWMTGSGQVNMTEDGEDADGSAMTKLVIKTRPLDNDLSRFLMRFKVDRPNNVTFPWKMNVEVRAKRSPGLIDDLFLQGNQAVFLIIFLQNLEYFFTV